MLERRNDALFAPLLIRDETRQVLFEMSMLKSVALNLSIQHYLSMPKSAFMYILNWNELY
jgi:hypothetical protein